MGVGSSHPAPSFPLRREILAQGGSLLVSVCLVWVILATCFWDGTGLASPRGGGGRSGPLSRPAPMTGAPDRPARGGGGVRGTPQQRHTSKGSPQHAHHFEANFIGKSVFKKTFVRATLHLLSLHGSSDRHFIKALSRGPGGGGARGACTITPPPRAHKPFPTSPTPSPLTQGRPEPLPKPLPLSLTPHPGRSLTGNKKNCSVTQFSLKCPRAHHVLAVGGWRLAAGDWRLVAVGGPLGRSLRVVLNKKKTSSFRTPLPPPPLSGPWNTIRLQAPAALVPGCPYPSAPQNRSPKARCPRVPGAHFLSEAFAVNLPIGGIHLPGVGQAVGDHAVRLGPQSVMHADLQHTPNSEARAGAFENGATPQSGTRIPRVWRAHVMVCRSAPLEMRPRTLHCLTAVLRTGGVGGGGVGTRPWYLIVCRWRRLLASRHCSF